MKKNFHLVLIPDGNRRWARKRNLPAFFGHRRGIKIFEKILEKSLELKIPYFTFWGGSFDNLTKRAKEEIKFLFKIYHQSFQKLLKTKRIHQEKVRVRVLGHWPEILPKKTQKVIERLVEATKNYQRLHLTFLLAYNGTDEMISCFQKIADLASKKRIKITTQLIKENLWTKDLPQVDLVIRTGCENDPHNSTGLLMWDTAYSQFYFSENFFPDFTAQEFEEVIEDFLKKERRFGQ